MVRWRLWRLWFLTLTVCPATAAEEVYSDPVQPVSIGIRFVVDDGLAQAFDQRQSTEAALKRYVEELNGYYRNSRVVLHAEIVDVTFAQIFGEEATRILADMEREQGGFEAMFRRANQLGADFTIAVHGQLMMQGRRGCGRAFAVNKTIAELSSTRRAFAVIDFACGAHTLAHELGHLMGLNHGVAIDQCQPGKGHKTAIAPYANGYAIGQCDGQTGPDKFGTIMVGGWMRAIQGNQKSLPLFSNPRLRDPRCGRSGICGDPVMGDEARALNENACYYASHEKPDIQCLRDGE
jgi:hypothetical protein